MELIEALKRVHFHFMKQGYFLQAQDIEDEIYAVLRERGIPIIERKGKIKGSFSISRTQKKGDTMSPLK